MQTHSQPIISQTPKRGRVNHSQQFLERPLPPLTGSLKLNRCRLSNSQSSDRHESEADSLIVDSLMDSHGHPRPSEEYPPIRGVLYGPTHVQGLRGPAVVQHIGLCSMTEPDSIHCLAKGQHAPPLYPGNRESVRPTACIAPAPHYRQALINCMHCPTGSLVTCQCSRRNLGMPVNDVLVSASTVLAKVGKHAPPPPALQQRQSVISCMQCGRHKSCMDIGILACVA